MLFSYIQYIVFMAVFIGMTKFNLCREITIIGRKSNLGWYVQGLLFTVLAAGRAVYGNYGGADANGYKVGFLETKDIYEEGFFFLNKCIRSFTDNYHIYFFIVYGVIVLCMLYFIKGFFDKDADLMSLCLLFDMYFQAFNVLRQWLAVGVGLVALVQIKKSRWMCALLFAVISCTIHRTMMVYVCLILFCFIVTRFNWSIDCKKLIKWGIIINALSAATGRLFIYILKHTSYKNYVSADLLASHSWAGYIPTIAFCILCMLLARYIQSEESFDTIALLFIWAHFSSMYMCVALGMFRLMSLFQPIRAYMAYKVGRVIGYKYKVTKQAMPTKYLFLVLIGMDCLLWMMRTVGNGALPYIWEGF